MVNNYNTAEHNNYTLCNVYTIIEATATTITSLENVNLFRYYFYCTGEERNLTDCATKAVHSNLHVCSGNKVAGVICNFNKAGTMQYAEQLYTHIAYT